MFKRPKRNYFHRFNAVTAHGFFSFCHAVWTVYEQTFIAALDLHDDELAEVITATSMATSLSVYDDLLLALFDFRLKLNFAGFTVRCV